MDDGQATIQGLLCEGVLVLVQNLFESLAIHFIMEGIRLTQNLFNLCIEPRRRVLLQLSHLKGLLAPMVTCVGDSDKDCVETVWTVR